PGADIPARVRPSRRHALHRPGREGMGEAGPGEVGVKRGRMKHVFFGTPEVASETLSRLEAAGLRTADVVTNADAPKGRGHVLTPSPVKVLAESLDVPVLTPDKLDDEFQKEVGAYGADLAFVVAYGKILPEPLINSFPK